MFDDRLNGLVRNAPVVLLVLAHSAWIAAPPVVPHARAPARITSLACAGCHPREASAWRGTLHARAWRDPVFAAAYRDEPMAFCRGCHAPLADPAREPDLVARDEGVSCAQCHAGSESHAATRGLAHADGAAPASRRCGACHQFAFPVDRGAGATLWRTTLPMQDTVGEWRRSEAGARGEGCVACHMPGGDHRLRGVEEPAFLRGAAVVEAECERRGDAVTVTARVRATGVGHALPTGDIERQVRLTVWVEGDARSAREHVFARRFEEAPFVDDRGETHFARRERLDGRLAPPGRDDEDTVTLALSSRVRGTVRWRLALLRTSPELARAQGLDLDALRATIAEGAAVMRTNAPRSRP